MSYQFERLEMLLDRWEKSSAGPSAEERETVFLWLITLAEDPALVTANRMRGVEGLIADIPGTTVSFWYLIDDKRQVITGLLLETL